MAITITCFLNGRNLFGTENFARVLILHELAANKSMLNEVYLLYVSADYLLERQTDFCILVRVSAQPLQSYLTLCNP